MKTNNKAYSFLAGAMALCLITILSAFTPIHEGLHQAMQKMMQKMKAMKMTGDPDKDFAMMMIEHHQGAIDAANIVLKSGKDSKIKEMAQKTLRTQPEDQKKLREHAQMKHDDAATAKNDKNHSNHAQSTDATSHSDQFSADMHTAMDQMETKMKNMKMTGKVDHDFATMMIDHHQGAIDMSDVEIEHGKNADVKSLAEKIKSDSQKDIAELKEWLSSHGK